MIENYDEFIEKYEKKMFYLRMDSFFKHCWDEYQDEKDEE